MRIILTLLTLLSGSAFCPKVPVFTTQLTIRGMVMDAQTKEPLSGVSFYDQTNQQMGVSTSDGLFDFTIQVKANAGLNFSFRIEKEGYASYVQTERWADIGSHLNVVYYFGIRRNATNTVSTFSEMELTKGLISNQEIKSGWKHYEKKIEFEEKIDSARYKKNDPVFLIDTDYYLVSDTGWLKLASNEDVILLNGKERVLAKDLNTRLKRAQIKSMSPSNREKSSFEIETN